MKIDKKAYVHPSAQLMGDIEIKADANIWPLVVMRGDMGKISIGESTNIQDGTVCHATHDLSETLIGDRVTVGHRAILHGCIVEDECLIGMGSILMDNCVIGKGSFIGAGSLVLANTKIPPGSLVLGSPGKVIRPVNEREAKVIADSWPHYVENSKRY
ncbi:MAG: gamma carbonic anhydrase family protein [Deltaproteobacteria bacterium]|nr:gamma carbonic anhydrase family protein [Deltaproteobacteria bacterium]